MRVLILSDIHSNSVALKQVLEAAGSVDQIWNLGDTIGYGPAPNECVAAVQQAPFAVAGNHDLACLGKLRLDDFNTEARLANLWNGEQLTPESRAYLEGLNASTRVDQRFMIAHGSPREPVWEYLLYPEQAQANLALFDTQICLIGHSHVQLYFECAADGTIERVLPDEGEHLKFVEDRRYFVNPGSVGQPRDRDPRAAFMIYDSEAHEMQFRRVGYDIGATQRAMRAAGLPELLARRLELGM